MRPSPQVSRRNLLSMGALGTAALVIPHTPFGQAPSAAAASIDGPGWQLKPDLLPPEGAVVFGVFPGTGESLVDVSDLLRDDVGLVTVYWKQLQSPRALVERNRANGIITRLELELTHAFGEAGYPVAGMWAQIAAGAYDVELTRILDGIGPLVSINHEADLAPDEMGGYQGVKAGSPVEFAAMWRHVVNLARELGNTETRWFFDMSFKVALWGENLTAEGSTAMYPGHNYVDFVGWDGFCWLNVPYHQPLALERTSFGQMMERYGRWAWYKRNFGDRGGPNWKPLMIGETACCEAELPHQPADEWIDDMRTWLHAHPDVTHVIWFSVLYAGSHDRRLSVGPQKRSGTRRTGRDNVVKV